MTAANDSEETKPAKFTRKKTFTSSGGSQDHSARGAAVHRPPNRITTYTTIRIVLKNCTREYRSLRSRPLTLPHPKLK